MGKIILIFTFCLFSLTQILAQTTTVTKTWINSPYSIPFGIHYSAVAKDKEGIPLADEEITFKIHLLKGSATGPSFYSETHKKTTNGFGFVSFVIFDGTDPTSRPDSVFWLTNWVEGPVFIKLEMANERLGDILVGTSEIQSVPYALIANYAGVAQVAHIAGPFYQVGQVAEGGIVFATWDGGRHGWVVALEDESANTTWHNAERLVQAKNTGEYRDWKIPTMAQLNLLYVMSPNFEVGEYKPMTNIYWSSNSQFHWSNLSIIEELPSRDEAFFMFFSGEFAGSENSIDKNYTDEPIGVRAVREF